MTSFRRVLLPRILPFVLALLLCAGQRRLLAASVPVSALSTSDSALSRLSLGLKRWRALALLGLPQTFGLRGGPGGRQGAAVAPSLRVLVQATAPAAAAALQAAGYPVLARVGRVVLLDLSPDELMEVASAPGVRRLQLEHPHRLHLDVNTAKNGAIEARAVSRLTGAGVLFGLIDSGIDFTHADFRNADGTTRIRLLWDQFDQSFSDSGGSIGSAPPVQDASHVPVGTVYTADRINAALLGQGKVNSVDLLGHGTHVAGCAASDGLAPGGYTGVAPQADIIAVRVGGTSKQDLMLSGDVTAALQWIGDQAAALGEPVVVNMSFGDHFGPHDDTSAEEMAIDDFVSQPGRVVTVSAGNEGEAFIHTSGSAKGGHPLQVRVDSSTNDLLSVDCWFDAADVVDLGFFDPTGKGTVDANVPVGDCVQERTSTSFVSLCVDTVDPLNNSREVMFLAEPLTSGGTIPLGTWQIILRDEGGVTNGRYQCWSANEQPFTADVDASDTVGMPATARGAIAVGAASFRVTWPSQAGPTQLDSPALDDLAFFSSLGPTRDGRIKPDIVTGGNWVVSAWSRADGTGSGLAGVPPDPRRVSADGVHVSSRGTSFSAPQVAGAAALLLQANPRLTGQEVGDIVRASAFQDEFTGAAPNDSWGYGKLDVAAAVEKVLPVCVGDCNGDGAVSVDELVLATRIALGEIAAGQCSSADRDGNGRVTIDELTGAVNAALLGCHD